MRIGFLVNPIAGLGGSVGLKGTDGPGTVAEARARGATDKAGPRATEALTILASRVPGARLVTVEGALGTDWAKGLDLKIKVATLPVSTGTAKDTRDGVRAIGAVDLMVFAGGDGTARDVAESLPEDTPLLGIPAGVKMHSGVFAVTPRAAGAILALCLDAPARVRWQEAEIMDIDENALRKGVISPQLYGMRMTPLSGGLMQASKGGPPADAVGALKGAAREITADMQRGTIYVIGPGRSAGEVVRALGDTPTLLGVDVVLDGKVIARDATASQLDDLTKGMETRIILGVTGQQGFLLGRGNQQISADLVERVGRAGLIVIASASKLATLAAPRLLVDTGRARLDETLAGHIRVKTAPGRSTMMRIASE